MPRNPKPLTLLVDVSLYESPEIQELVRKGHEVYKIVESVDLIIGPHCQLMTGEHLKYLPEAIKRTRKLKYGGKIDDDSGA